MTIVRYQFDEGKEIIGNVMPDLELVSFSEVMIRFNAESIFQFLKADYEKKNNTLVNEAEEFFLRMHSLKAAAEQLQKTVDDNMLPY